jgi:hypothetical protein
MKHRNMSLNLYLLVSAHIAVKNEEFKENQALYTVPKPYFRSLQQSLSSENCRNTKNILSFAEAVRALGASSEHPH